MGTFRGVDVKFRAAPFSRGRASIAVGGWPFPCRGFPRPTPMRSSFRRSLSLRLTPPLRRPSVPLATLAPRPTEADRGLGFLSWSSSKIAPSPISPCASSLGCPRFGFATPEHVPPLSFFPTSTVSSAHGFAGLLHPATGHGVRPVSCRRADLRRLPDIPPSVPFPFEALPDSSGGLSPGSLPPRRCPVEPKFHVPRPRGFVPVSRSAPAVLPRLVHRASMGFPRPRLSPKRPPFWGWHPFG